MISMHVGIEHVSNLETQLANQCCVTGVLLEYRIDDDRFTGVVAPKQIAIGG